MDFDSEKATIFAQLEKLLRVRDFLFSGCLLSKTPFHNRKY